METVGKFSWKPLVLISEHHKSEHQSGQTKASFCAVESQNRSIEPVPTESGRQKGGIVARV